MNVKEKSGITLIALIITIIVLLILAGITIALVVGDNGILNRSKNAKSETEIKQAVEETRVYVMGKLTENLGVGVTEAQVKEALNEYFYNVPEDLTDGEQELETKPNHYKVKLSEVIDFQTVHIVDDNVIGNNTTTGGNTTPGIGDYVRDGLILWYDGIQNTRAGNNPNAAVWEDLSGNNNDGIFSSVMVANQSEITDTSKGYYDVTEQGYVFWHNDAYIESTNNIGIEGDAVFTVEAVINPYVYNKNSQYSARTDIGRNIVWFGKDQWDCGSNFAMMCPIAYSNMGWGVDAINYGYTTGANTVNYDEKVSISAVKDKTGDGNGGDTGKYRLFTNGQYSPTAVKNWSGTYHIEDAHVIVGRGWQFWDHNRTLYGAVCAIRIYNRILTDEEVAQNYSVDEARFNIE